MLEVERNTIREYDQIAKQWAMEHNTPNYWGRYFDLFMQQLPTGSIIEVGCGAGRDAEILIQRGYEWVGTDASQAMVDLAKVRHPGREVYRAIAEQLNLVPELKDRKFDGFLASAVLLHIPRFFLFVALNSIRSLLRPGAVGFVTMKNGSGDEIKDGRFFVYYSLREFSAILIENGFEIACCGEYKRTPQCDTTWLVYVVTRR